MKIVSYYCKLLCVTVMMVLWSGWLSAQEVCDTTLWVTCCSSELPYQYQGQSFSQSGSYEVHLTSTSGCDSVVHLNLEVITPNLVVTGDLSFCEGQSTTLTASGGQSYEWRKSIGPQTWFPAFSFNAEVVLTDGGTYKVTATDSYGCTVSQQFVVTKKNLPNVSISYISNEVCEGTSVLLSANWSQGYSYLWSTGSTDRQISVNTSGTYFLQVTANGCSASDSVIVTVNPKPDISFLGQDQLCQGDTVTLYAVSSSAVSYSWNTGATDSAIRVYESGIYSVTVQNVFGCEKEDSVVVWAQQYPNVTIIGPSTACEGSEVILTAFGTAAGYLWSTGDTTAQLVIHPTSGGSYQVTGYTADHVCSASATTFVFVNEIYDTIIEVSLCSNELPFVYNGVSYTQSGTYDIHLTTIHGCDSTVHLNLIVLESPILSISGDSLICHGSSTLLYANSNTAFLWNTGETYSPIIVSDTGWYVLSATASNGCRSADSMHVAYRPDMGLTVTGERSFCEGQSTTLTASGGQLYVWEIDIPGYGRYPFEYAAEVTLYEGGIYFVTATDVYGCTSSQQLNIIKKNLPNASIYTYDYDHMVCEGTGIQLSAIWSQDYSYLWSTGSTASQITVYSPDIYVLQVTADGCTAVDSINISMYPLPSVSFSGDTIICRYHHATVYASASDAVSYLWSTGDTVDHIDINTVVNTSSYWVNVENSHGCVKRDTVLVKVEDTPQVDIVGPDSICDGGSVTLVASGGVQYLWDNDSTTAERTIYEPGTYFVTITTAGGCWAGAQKSVYHIDAPDIRIVGRDHICAGDSVRLTIPGLESCVWFDGSTDSTITIHEAGVYWVEGWNEYGCFVRDTIEVVAATSPTVQIMGNPSGCVNNVNMLTAVSSSAVSYLWNTGDTTLQIQALETGLYSVWVSDSNACHASASFSFEMKPSPTCTIEGDTELCSGDTTTLTASGGLSYFWSTGDTSASIRVAPATTCNYSLVIADSNGCTASANVQVVVQAATPIVISGLEDFCEGDSVLLVAETNGNLMWSTGQYGDSIWVYETGDYLVWSIDSDACQKSSTKHVEKHLSPEVQIEGASSLCMGDTSFLYASTQVPVSYQWSTGSSESSILVVSTNVYGVSVTDMYGCTNYASKLVMAYSSPTVVINGPSSICYGESAILSVGGAAVHYQWSTGDTTPMITVNPLYTTTYYVVAYNSNGCSSTAYYSLAVNPVPMVTITGDTAICEGETTILTSSNASSFLWSNGATSRSISVSDEGVYSVVVTNSMGCTNSVSTHVQVFNRPNLMILGDTTLCQGGHTELLAIGGDSYLWSNGATTPNIVVAPDQNTSYSVQASNGACVSEMTRQIIVKERPDAVIIAPDGICTGASAIMTAQGGQAYLWSTGQTAAQIEVQSSGIYQLVAFSSNGCTDTVSHILSLYPTPQLTIFGDTALCQGEQGVLTATGLGTFLWSTGDTTPSIEVTASAYYHVQLTDFNGCVAYANRYVSAIASPTIVIYGVNDICENDTTNLTVFCTNTASFIWNTGESSNTITVSPSGTTTYSVTAVSADNCIAQQNHTITVHPSYFADFWAEICVGQSYSGQGFNIPLQNESGEFDYVYTLQTAYGCDSVRILHLTVNPLPVITGVISGNTQPTSVGNYVYMIEPVENATSYEWILSNPNWNISYNQTVAQVSVLSPGTASLSVYALNECGQSLPVSTQITFGTGINGIDMYSVRVFPNPTQGITNIQCMMSDGLIFDGDVQLLDMYGTLLGVWKLSGENMKLDMSQYAAGVYLLKLRNTLNSTESIVKVVKE